MSVYMTEDEQVEQIKKWWRQYGNSILTVILLIALVFTGWRWWQQRQFKIATNAAVVYERLLEGVVEKDASGVSANANTLLTQYASSPYAALAALNLAKEAVTQQQYDVALKHLQWVVDNADIPALKQIARIRSASIMLSQQKAQQALEILAKVNDKTYDPITSEMRGDSYVMLGDEGKAKQAYQLALQSTSNSAIPRPLLKMKLNNLSAVKPHATA